MNLPKRLFERYPETEKYKNCIKYLQYIMESCIVSKRHLIKTNRPIGIILITSDNNIGWSMLHEKDKWDKLFGIRKALYKLQPIEIFHKKRKLIPKYQIKKRLFMNRIADIIYSGDLKNE